MALHREIVYHETESEKYTYATGRKSSNQERQGGGKVHNNRGLGTAEIILVLAVLIVLIFLYRERMVELAVSLCREYVKTH